MEAFVQPLRIPQLSDCFSFYHHCHKESRVDPITTVGAANWGARVWKAVGGSGLMNALLKPLQIKREGMATIDIKVKERLALTQAEVDAQAIIEGKKSYSVEQWRLISHETSKLYQPEFADSPHRQEAGIASIAMNSLVAEKVKKEINVARAALVAEEILDDEPGDPPTSEPSQDWVDRWRENAERVTDEQMQELWGRVLAGELKRPGTYTLRALETVKNLSKEDADLISKIAPFLLYNFIFRFEDNSFYDKHSLRFNELLELQDLGILAGVEALGLEKTFNVGVPDSPLHLILDSLVLKISPPPGISEIKIPIYAVTKLGMQIISLAAPVQDLSYLANIRDALAPRNYRVSAHKIIEKLPDGNARFSISEISLE